MAFSPLFTAVEKKNDKLLAALLKADFDPNATGSYDQTPLEIACSTGREKAVVLLLEHGADVNAGNGALASATNGGHTKIVEVLLEAGADVNPKPAGWTPLMWAGQAGNEEVAQLLLDAGAKKGVKNRKGETAADVAEEAGHKKLAKLLR